MATKKQRTAKQEIQYLTRLTAKHLGISSKQVEEIHKQITVLPEAKELRECALAFAAAVVHPGDSDDSACDLANRNLLNAAILFGRAVRAAGEKD